MSENSSQEPLEGEADKIHKLLATSLMAKEIIQPLMDKLSREDRGNLYLCLMEAFSMGADYGAVTQKEAQTLLACLNKLAKYEGEDVFGALLKNDAGGLRDDVSLLLKKLVGS